MTRGHRIRESRAPNQTFTLLLAVGLEQRGPAGGGPAVAGVSRLDPQQEPGVIGSRLAKRTLVSAKDRFRDQQQR